MEILDGSKEEDEEVVGDKYRLKALLGDILLACLLKPSDSTNNILKHNSHFRIMLDFESLITIDDDEM
jgi:hypothetical protein